MRVEDKDDLYNTVFTELKKLGVKVPKVKKFKTIVSKQEKALPQSKSKIFGVCLCDQEWTADCDFILPKFIASSIAYLRDFITVEGLFRKAGSIARQRDLRIKLENGETLDGSEPNDVASLLKQWLRELPEPLIPNYMHDLYIRCQQLDTSEKRVTAHLLACLLLPADHLRTLKYLLLFLSDFALHSEKNKMDIHNLALIIAPNIFVMGAEVSQDLFELYTSISESLINNAGNVGGIPASVSFQHPALDSCSELDSSGDILDASPCKSRKKRRSGPVQDIFNGIKKLVGQTTTPAPRSASKRKADNNDGSLPKKLTVEVNGERTSCETPKNKGSQKLVNTDGKIGRTRKKSFGLLRRKRQKSSQDSPQSKISPSSKSPFNWDVDVKMDNANNNSLQLPDLPSPVSPFNFFDSDKALKSDSIKKSTSDRYLIVPSAKVSVMFPSTSQGQLRNRFEASPYNLRSKIEGCQKSQMQSLESIQLEMKTIMGDAEEEPKFSNQQEISSRLPVVQMSPLASAELNLEICKEEKVVDIVKKPESIEHKIQASTVTVGVIESRDKSSRRSSRRKKNGCYGYACESTMSGNKNSENGDAKSLLSETLLQLDPKLSNKSNSKVTHTSRNAKQETSNLKLQQKKKNPLDLSKSHEVNNMKKKSHEIQPLKKDIKNPQLRKCQSVNLGSKSDSHGKNMSARKVAEKTTRKASLIRGRPNTVKSGLPSDLCQRFNNDSIIIPNSDFVEDPVLLTNNNANKKFSPLDQEAQVKESASILNHNEKETNCLDKRVSPLNLKFQFFTLSSPPTTSPISNSIPDLKSNSNTAFPIFDDSSFTKQDSESHLKIKLDASQKRKSSLPVFDENALSSGSKIPRMRQSLDAASRKSSLNKASTDLKRKSSSSLSNENSTKIPVKCANSLKDLSMLDVSMNDSCFKTPNKIASPDSIIWMSGKKYLDANFPQNEEPFNKRESIAMILKQKPGHVQSKVHLWDTKVRESVYCTRSVPTYSTPTSAFMDKEAFQKQRSNSQRNRKPMSISKSGNSANTNKNRIKPPLPPPPKFVAPESNTPSPNVSRPLKEVTNVSFGMNESKNSINTSLSKDEFGLLDISLENLVPTKNRRKVSRNSFTDCTPQKRQKRVSRSESSPCPRPVRRAPRIVPESTVGSQSPVLEDYLAVPTQRLLRSSTSKSGSCLSIEI